MTSVNAVLSSWYEGEIGGEALFSRLAELADSSQGHKWRTLAQLESHVATHLAQVLTDLNFPLTAPEGIASRASARCAAIATKQWLETMHWLRDIAAEALREFQSDAIALPPTLAATAALVVRHELALIEFAELELAGHGERSLQPITATIAYLTDST